MSTHQPGLAPDVVNPWPRVAAVLNTDATGTITIHGTSRACHAPTLDTLRTGIIARAVSLAQRLYRPIRLDVTDPTIGTITLGVRPAGIVQLLAADGTLPHDEDLIPHHGPCRSCGHDQPVTNSHCTHCNQPEPHSVETKPSPLERIIPDAQSIEDHHGDTILTHSPANSTVRLQLVFTTQPDVEVDAPAALGRAPHSTTGHNPVTVDSPTHAISATHLLIDVDTWGRLVVIDNHSTNGTSFHTSPPFALQPGHGYIINTGTSIQLADVTCTIHLI